MPIVIKHNPTEKSVDIHYKFAFPLWWVFVGVAFVSWLIIHFIF